MWGYDSFDRRGYCHECGAARYVSGDLIGCSNASCEHYASTQELFDAEEH